jgi:hypothetical protein
VYAYGNKRYKKLFLSDLVNSAMKILENTFEREWDDFFMRFSR